MKVLHTADWHLGIDLHKMPLRDDQRDFVRQLEEIIVEEEVDVMLVAGDIYDTTLASREAIELYNEIMTMVCLKHKKQVIVIAGNHDSSTRLASCADLLAPMGLHIFGKIEGKVKGLRIGDTLFYPIPFFHTDTVRNIYETDVRNEEEAYRVICEDLRSSFQSGDTHIALAHAFMSGANVCDSDRFANVGGSDQISSSVFEGFDYVALGHLHRFQQVGKHVRYSGSPLPYSFSEANQEKRVILYDTLSKTVSTRCITPLHPLQVIRGTFDEVKLALQRDLNPNAYVKVEVEDMVVSYEMLDYFRQYSEALLQLSGKSAIKEGAGVTMQVDDMDHISDVDIVKQFFSDYYEETLGEEELAMFIEAVQASSEVEDAT